MSLGQFAPGSAKAKRRATRPPNKRMQLTKLRAAPVWRAEVPPCASAGQRDGGTASQLIRSVIRTYGPAGRGESEPDACCTVRRRMEDMMRFSWSMILLAGVLAAPSASTGAQATDEAAIRARVQEYVAAFNRGDAKAAASVYALDGTHTYAFGFTHRGRAAIEKGLAALLAGPFKGTHLTITTEAIRFLTPAIAVEEESFEVSGVKTATGAEQPPVKGLCLDILQKQGDVWFAVAVQCLVPPPPAEAPQK